MPLDLKKHQYVPVLVLLMFFWALIHPLSKMIVADVSPALMAFLRNVLGALTLLLIVGLKKTSLKIEKKDMVPMALLGIAGTALASLLMFIGIELSSATNASILINANPIFIALLAPLLIHEKLERKQLAGVLLAFVGMVLVTTNGLGLEQLLQSTFFLGNIALIGGALLLMVYTVYGKHYVKKYGGVVATIYTVAAGAVFLLFYSIFTGDIANMAELSLHEWLVLLYIGAVITGFIYAVWYGSIRHIGAARASSFKLLIPVFATATAIVMLGEAPGIFVIGGGFLVIAGLALTQKTF
jgi:drug/metabolite transporter (DMT)-like permease